MKAPGRKTSPFRLSLKDDEARQPWLPMLIDAYATIDEGVAAAITAHSKKSTSRLACTQGCSNCCRTPRDIPLYPIELVGIYWYAIEKLDGKKRNDLKTALLRHRKGDACPFLLNNACAIHPMRPIACRQFNVFGMPCEAGEDPFYTRRGDVLTPIQAFTDHALDCTLPFYRITEPKARRHAIETRMINAHIKILQDCAWNELPWRMDAFAVSRR
ncbi:MAG TPA: YkgJ family cysteine cluster protein [Dissulfurispiraceae bacterium]|nr:YkgJ family cysteine cluster protein [Dissulfurispiraceae bacterium]